MMDFLPLAVVFGLTAALAIGWLFCSSQVAVDRSAINAVKIFVRLTLVFATVIGMAHFLMGVSLATLFAVSLIVIPWSALVSIDEPPGDSAIEMIAWGVFWLPFYFTREFVLGFPMRKELVLEPPRDANTTPSLEHLYHLPAVVTSPLRPNGTIEIDGIEHLARSTDGTLIATGTDVTAHDSMGSTLLVNVRVANTAAQEQRTDEP